MKIYPRALTIAGSDSGGGAGVQADLKTFSALGCFGMSAITALTAQNTIEVAGIYPVSPEFIGMQIDAVFTDIGADAVKIGMLHSPEVIEIVAEKLKKYKCNSIILDPVMVAKSGDKLLQDDAINTLKKVLIPLATIITPNLPEASVLLGKPVETREQMYEACRDLSLLGCKNILLKGGHLTESHSVDFLYLGKNKKLIELDEKRIATKNSHGTGCTISSAVAAYMARKNSIENSVKKAKSYITGALEAGSEYRTGSGHGPVHHFYRFW